MALDVLSLNDTGGVGHHSNARCVHGSELSVGNNNDGAKRAIRKKERRRASMSDCTFSVRPSSSLTITTVGSKQFSAANRRSSIGSKLSPVAKRRTSIGSQSLTAKRKTSRKKKTESSGDNSSKRDTSSKSAKKKKKKTKKSKSRSKSDTEATTNDNDADPLDSGRTEHTSNMTEHLRSVPIDIDSDGDDDDDDEFKRAEDEFGAQSESEQTESNESFDDDASRASRFSLLLNKWKKREDESLAAIAKTNTGSDEGGSQAPSYLAESEHETCFEGVLKHWKSKDDEGQVQHKGSDDESFKKNQTVVVDDNASIMSGLTWGNGSDSRFDFAYDARFDSALNMSPTPRRKTLVGTEKDGKKKKKSEKKDRDASSKSKKKKDKKEKKTSAKSLGVSMSMSNTYDIDSSMSEVTMDATDNSFIFLEDCSERSARSTMSSQSPRRKQKKKVGDDQSIRSTTRSTMSTKKKKKKKNDSSKLTKKTEESSSKTRKNKSKSKKVKKTATDGSINTNLDVTHSTYASMADSPSSGSQDDTNQSFLPNWLSPNAAPTTLAATGTKPPVLAKEFVQFLPDLLVTPEKPSSVSSLELHALRSPETVPYLPNLLVSSATATIDTGRKADPPC